jgi:hypothetical protein
MTDNDTPSKEDLEKQKLGLEIAQLEKPWYRKPEWWPPIATIVVIVGGLLGGFLSKENLIQQISNLKKSKDSLEITNGKLGKRNSSSLQTVDSLNYEIKIISLQRKSDSTAKEKLGGTLTDKEKLYSNLLTKYSLLKDDYSKLNFNDSLLQSDLINKSADNKNLLEINKDYKNKIFTLRDAITDFVNTYGSYENNVINGKPRIPEMEVLRPKIIFLRNVLKYNYINH